MTVDTGTHGREGRRELWAALWVWGPTTQGKDSPFPFFIKASILIITYNTNRVWSLESTLHPANPSTLPALPAPPVQPKPTIPPTQPPSLSPTQAPLPQKAPSYPTYSIINFPSPPSLPLLLLPPPPSIEVQLGGMAEGQGWTIALKPRSPDDRRARLLLCISCQSSAARSWGWTGASWGRSDTCGTLMAASALAWVQHHMTRLKPIISTCYITSRAAGLPGRKVAFYSWKHRK